ncbi:glycolate oxidase iron-sulfur subunit [Paracidovorax avenae]|uniref:glycolate oxidase subunit GlcF n=1 Tax=Paracidovorax avenae TaxID=80867 RepID=UPI000D16838E|nr:glycolate oxidase subunit GlcF [Paracidovorax avenae]AVS79827.1 glycolate oxidase iron-sulfur subunit [Paracidovorax avenae]AVT01185.1 glycolate oxidase iron-sulfur subunit [Paracidovorax avenae]AVT14942.1 glycolate oxidase iron-sulfur subunit [Paracidovorax avenae]
MQTRLAPEFQDTPEGREAEGILRKCVHCGFCTATCPTYQLLGDELDGPRGRIYLIKQVLEGETPTRKTQLHLDRCLTCRNCETTCPSGVQYGRLVDIGRRIVEDKVPRPLPERARRWALKEGLPSPLFKPALKAGQAVRGLLPAALRAKVPRPQEAGAWPVREHARKVLMLAGCVQPAMLPNVNRATARVLDAAGIQTVIAAGEGCCGAVKFHLNDQDGGLAQMRANVDAWWPHVEAGGVEAIVLNASGCGATVKEYGHLLRHDPAYAARAERISALARDLSELLPDMLPVLAERLEGRIDPPRALLAYHPPCTLQHGQKLRGGVEAHLARLGFRLRVARTESHLCCGSAGTYSLLQPEIAGQLRDRKLGALDEACAEEPPAAILSANIGCITHLQSGTRVPVRHWVEVLDEALRPGAV